MVNGDFFSYESINRNPKKTFRIIVPNIREAPETEQQNAHQTSHCKIKSGDIFIDFCFTWWCASDVSRSHWAGPGRVSGHTGEMRGVISPTVRPLLSSADPVAAVTRRKKNCSAYFPVSRNTSQLFTRPEFPEWKNVRPKHLHEIMIDLLIRSTHGTLTSFEEAFILL